MASVNAGINHGSAKDNMVNWRKDSGPRLPQVSRAERDLRWEYGETDMTLTEFEQRLEQIRKTEHVRKHPSG